MYKAIDWAKYIVNKCTVEKCPISNLQLQKILYYIQREYIINRDSLAFPEEMEAWQFGPVVPNVYYRFCASGAMPIEMEYPDVEIAIEDRDVVDSIIEKKRILKPWDLVDDTHKKQWSWYKTYKDGKGSRNVIKKALIREDN